MANWKSEKSSPIFGHEMTKIWRIAVIKLHTMIESPEGGGAIRRAARYFELQGSKFSCSPAAIRQCSIGKGMLGATNAL
jgi:hypothetical protein